MLRHWLSYCAVRALQRYRKCGGVIRVHSHPSAVVIYELIIRLHSRRISAESVLQLIDSVEALGCQQTGPSHRVVCVIDAIPKPGYVRHERLLILELLLRVVVSLQLGLVPLLAADQLGHKERRQSSKSAKQHLAKGLGLAVALDHLLDRAEWHGQQ